MPKAITENRKSDKLAELLKGLYIEIQPPAALRDYIKAFFFFDFEGESAHVLSWKNRMQREQNWERVIPFGCSDIIIQSREAFELLDGKGKRCYPLPQIFLSPLSVGPIKLHKQHPVRIAGIRMWPWMHKSFAGLGDELQGVVSLTDIFISNGLDTKAIFTNNIQYATEQLAKGFTSILGKVRKPDEVLRDAIQYILSEAGNIPDMQQLYRRYNVTPRRIEQIFKHGIGICPKHYARIIKFQNIFKTIHQQNPKSLTDLVYECGYYDQAHFIRTFQEFTGTSPGKYLREINPISQAMTASWSTAFLLSPEQSSQTTNDQLHILNAIAS